MIVRVQNKTYDDLSVLWTKGKNKGGGEKRENAKSIGQMSNKERRKSNKTRSMSQCGGRMVQDEGMRSKQGKGNTGTELARRRTKVASPRDPDNLAVSPRLDSPQTKVSSASVRLLHVGSRATPLSR
jgi:hypothetical protein